MTTAIIGAGMAGLACAQALAADGREVRLFDKGRGPGGRMATRRAEIGGHTISFDHGAQYFTAQSQEFARQAAQWCAAGIAAPWVARFSDTPPHHRYVGVPGMSAIIRHMAGPLAVSWGCEVVSLERMAGGWMVSLKGAGRAGPYETAVIAVPPEQAATLLMNACPSFAARAAGVRSRPCWAAMLAYQQAPELEIDAARAGSDIIAWHARDNSKPGRGARATFVVHAAPSWSEQHLERDAGDVAIALAHGFRELTGAPMPDHVAAHRWRYAQVVKPLGEAFLLDQALRIATCGDWHLGNTIEAAWMSGRALAEDLLR